MIQRLAKGVLPPNTSIQKEALAAFSKSATVFVNYIAAHGNEAAQAAGKKTIQPLDVMAAIKELEFEEFLPRLEAELEKYNTIQCEKRNSYRRKVKEGRQSAALATTNGETPAPDSSSGGASVAGHSDTHDEDGPPAKKVRRTMHGDATSAGETDPEEDDLEEDEVVDEEEDDVPEDEGENEGDDEGEDEGDDGDDGGVNVPLEDPLEESEEVEEGDEALDDGIESD
ncbi:hypothetical protein LTR66_003798 [Elasticomyces elasticus]|nr:hypothetical protein LTR50_003553 [Elasticomyces elasticus]KAK4996628.1 hypothetical protein LTR66_003798 [Elasticomyces elasticus]